jgi:hypothetical protein
MKLSIASFFFCLFFLFLAPGCGQECCWNPGLDSIALIAVDGEGHDLPDMDSEPHYSCYHINVYYVDRKGNKIRTRDPNKRYGFQGEYNKYAPGIYLHPREAKPEKSTLIFEWEAGAKPDTLVALWNKDLEARREIYMNGELLEARSESHSYKYVEYVREYVREAE